jgi:mannosylfructose-6-phosphate phosphatase
MTTIRLFSSDLDGTLLGNTLAVLRFRDFWQSLEPESRPLLVYNSGRLIDDMEDIVAEEGLPPPDIYIGGVGTMLSGDHPDIDSAGFLSMLGEDFDVTAIDEVMRGIPGIERQPERYQHGYKSSWYLRDVDEVEIQDIEQRLQEAGYAARLVYSSSRDLDVLPDRADKGEALTWLCDSLGISLGQVVVAGDSGNDAGMFRLSEVRGVVVGNALPELVALTSRDSRYYRAKASMADGVIEGLKHWGVGQ